MGNLHKPRLEPSQAERWVHCPLSYIKEKELRILDSDVKEKNYRSAEEGIEAHEKASIILKEALKKRKLGESTLDFDMEKSANDPMYRNGVKYVKYVLNRLEEIEAECDEPVCEVERILDCSEYADNCIGTPDVYILGRTRLIVIDYKYGRYEQVFADDNPQLKIYALAALCTHKTIAKDVTEIELRIFQPRMPWSDRHVLRKEELIEWGENILRPAGIAIHERSTIANAGKWCKFCKYRHYCRSYFEQINHYEVVFEKISTDTVAHIHSLCVEARNVGEVLSKKGLVSLPEMQNNQTIINVAREISKRIKGKEASCFLETKEQPFEKYKPNDITSKSLYILSDSVRKKISSVTDFKMIYSNLFSHSMDEPVLLTDENNNLCLMVNLQSINQSLEDKIGKMGSTWRSEVKLKIDGKENVLVDQETYEQFREYCTKITDYLDMLDRVQKYNQDVLEEIVLAKTRTSEQEWKQAKEHSSCFWVKI